MAVNLGAIVRSVTQYTITHPDERDPWEKAPAITGILAWNDSSAVSAVQRWIDRAVETQGSEGYLCYPERIELPAGHVRTFTPTASLSASIGFPLLEFYARTKEPRYMNAAVLQAEALARAPRTRDGGISCRYESTELWVDFTYLMCPFLARLGKLTGDSQYIDEAYSQFEIHARHLVDPLTGLVRHAWCETPNHYPQSTFWARGNGWLIACATDLLEIAPGHAGAGFVRDACGKTLSAMRGLQDRSGFFRHILDDRFSKFEASSTVMFAYAAAKAVSLGVVEKSFLDDAVRGWTVVAGSVLENGAVPGVAVPPGGPGVPFGTTLFGQGFFLLAAHALRDQIGGQRRLTH
jgi:unsaturated rhamnogalacturonyl hydrolase